MLTNYNKHLFDFVYNDTITVNRLVDELVFPPSHGLFDLPKILAKINLTVGCVNNSIHDPYTITDKEVLFNANGDKTLTQMVCLLSLIPVIVGLRVYDDTYYIQTKSKEVVITGDVYLKLINEPLTTLTDVVGDNYILDNDDRYYRVGTHHKLTVRSDMLLGTLNMCDIVELDVDKDNYSFIHLSLPNDLSTITTFINGSSVVRSLTAETKDWIPMGVITDLLSSDIDKVRSSVIRKFIFDMQLSMGYIIDNEFDTNENASLFLNHVNRIWTDELKYLINKEFPGVVNTDFTTKRSFNKYVILVKNGCLNLSANIPSSILYYRDRNYILNKLNELTS